MLEDWYPLLERIDHLFFTRVFFYVSISTLHDEKVLQCTPDLFGSLVGNAQNSTPSPTLLRKLRETPKPSPGTHQHHVCPDRLRSPFESPEETSCRPLTTPKEVSQREEGDLEKGPRVTGTVTPVPTLWIRRGPGRLQYGKYRDLDSVPSTPWKYYRENIPLMLDPRDHSWPWSG